MSQATVSGTYYIQRHQDKARAYIRALNVNGWRRLSSWQDADIVFGHYDGNPSLRPQMQAALDAGKPLFTYPHAAPPPYFWDVVEPLEHTASFVPAQGHVDVMRAFGYPHPVHICGYAYCDPRPFRPQRDSGPLRVLYAPIHPYGSGHLSAGHAAANQAAFGALLPLDLAGHITLTVRATGSLDSMGVGAGWGTALDHLRIVRSQLRMDVAALDAYDVIVAYQTLAYNAVARGIPTVMLDQANPPTQRYQGADHEPANWHLYADIMRYPLSIDPGDDSDHAMAQLRAAIAGPDAVAAWRERMIGAPFDPGSFVAAVNQHTAEHYAARRPVDIPGTLGV